MDTVSGGEPLFDHERLHVFRAARDAYRYVAPWLKRRMSKTLHDQLERAMVSILSNIAEGAGKTARTDKQRFYEIAKGSTFEAAAQLEVLNITGVISAEEYAAVRKLLISVAKMLHKLCAPPRAA